MNVLIIIPARGGSKGIPRRNLRTLNGFPLIYYAIQTALKSKFKPDVYVSSEDEEILHISCKFGAKGHKRSFEIAGDKVTLDPVIYEAYKEIKDLEEKKYDFVVTLQPTSPLLQTASLDEALEIIETDDSIDTVISAIDDTHLTWKKRGDIFLPNYEERVNRQFLPKVYKETGGFFISRASVVKPDSRIGGAIRLHLITQQEAIDIDSYEDWNVCAYYLKRKKIVFVVTGNNILGLGHVYNTLIIANEILEHRIEFITDSSSQLAYDTIAKYNYPVRIQRSEHILTDIMLMDPDVVINDCLDTSEGYVKFLKEKGLVVINFEDLGSGASCADVVFNAIYPEKVKHKYHYFGPHYFCIRDEFILSLQKQVKPSVERVLITFGGVDPNNYTRKVLQAIIPYCKQNKISIDVVSGRGYSKFDTLTEFLSDVSIHRDVHNISDFILQADIVFTSAGRTVFEIACIGTPAIVIPQNERESTHFFASEKHGVINLGYGKTIEHSVIQSAFEELVSDGNKRRKMNKIMLKQELKHGKKRVIKIIKQTIEVS